ncbi:succinate--hydroxymethylglutarate CoA-transferase [Microdochium nivale]|nr:succinate--hydroxymethylglutarate CoA-transferase [Microdochium nivale]
MSQMNAMDGASRGDALGESQPTSGSATENGPTAIAPMTHTSLATSNSASSTPRPHYVPQFSAATQMILQRIGKPGSFSSVLSSASALSRDIEPSAFQDAKRRLVMNMNTSLTMPLPTPLKSQHETAANLPMNDAFQLRTPSLGKAAIVKMTTAKTLPLPKSASAVLESTSPAKTTTTKPGITTPRSSQKRKRVKTEDSNDSPGSVSQSHSGTPVAGGGRLPEAASPATTTKSGRQILKPTTYNPSTVAAAQVAAIQQSQSKRKHWGKRTAEQALCKVCTRGLSPFKNQVVFCDGCNLCWHQLCHEPYIDDEFVSDESRSWFCTKCMAKRERHLAKKKTVDGFRGVSWASKSADQKRAHLNSLPAAQLVNIVMYSLELHPDLPIFAASETGKRGATTLSTAASQITNGRSTPSDMSPRTPSQYSRKFSTPDHGKSGTKSTGTALDISHGQRNARESSIDSVPPSWPRSGQGCLANLNMNEDDFQDKNDHEAFSLTTYDGRGRKLLENGMAVATPGKA